MICFFTFHFSPLLRFLPSLALYAVKHMYTSFCLFQLRFLYVCSVIVLGLDVRVLSKVVLEGAAHFELRRWAESLLSRAKLASKSTASVEC